MLEQIRQKLLKGEYKITRHAMKNSLCAICGGKLRIQKTTLDRLVNGHLYLFTKAPVQVCAQCNEIWIPASEAEKMDQAIQGKRKPRRQIAVPVF